MNIGDWTRCPNCNGVYPYHNHPCNGGHSPARTIPPQFYPKPVDNGGCKPVPTLTEADVRRIVREELAKQDLPLTLKNIGGRP